MSYADGNATIAASNIVRTLNQDDATEAKAKNPRKIELVILKNRNGRTGDKIPFSFYPLFNYFAESE